MSQLSNELREIKAASRVSRKEMKAALKEWNAHLRTRRKALDDQPLSASLVWHDAALHLDASVGRDKAAFSKAAGDMTAVSAGMAFFDFCEGDPVVRHRKRVPRRRNEYAALCGALTRKGESCRCLLVYGNKRCIYHGGGSTGPRTPEGKAAIAESNRRRAKRDK